MITIVKEETPEIISEALKFENSEILRIPHQDDIVLRRVSNMLRLKTTLDYRNVMEDVVAEEIDANIDALGICHCAKCRNDLLILTLNSLKPKYVSSLKGAVLSRTDYMLQGRQTSVLTELVKAAAIIKERPRHN
jgi:competence protein ComFB